MYGKMEKGRAFELEVYHSLTATLANRELGLDPSLCKVFHRKAYYSKDRQKEIIADIAIEIYVLGQSKPSIVWIWECKDYSGSIPVDDVEEFHSKLEQLGADNTKGTIICRGTLQKAALNYAISKRIGVARLLPDSRIHPRVSIIVPHSIMTDKELTKGLKRASSKELRNALCSSEFMSWSRDFYGVTSGGLIEPWGRLDVFIVMELKAWGILPARRPIELALMLIHGSDYDIAIDATGAPCFQEYNDDES